jgi:hypothetical protein
MWNRQQNIRDMKLKGRCSKRCINRKIRKRLSKCDIGTSKVVAKNMTIIMISFMSYGTTREDSFSRTWIKFIITKILIMNIVKITKNL